MIHILSAFIVLSGPPADWMMHAHIEDRSSSLGFACRFPHRYTPKWVFFNLVKSTKSKVNYHISETMHALEKNSR
jgi:hypothetical protein